MSDQTIKKRLQVQFLCILACLSGLTGCTTLANLPAIPASRLPPGLLARSREEMVDISMSRLRQTPPDNYQLAANDVLGIYIENVIGDPEEPPPVNFPEEDSGLDPSIGFPIPIRDDGTIALPLIPVLKAEGKTIQELDKIIRENYISKKILKEGEERIIVTLMKKRTYRVLVVREEEGGIDGVTKRGSGYAVDLNAYENDVLHALNETGGMPGLDAKAEVVIYRGVFKDGVERDELIAQYAQGADPCSRFSQNQDEQGVIRIPLKYYPENVPRFTEDDIILQTGDIVKIESRDRETFYTGGVLPGGEHQLPRDKDLDILGAIALAGGSINSGGIIPLGGGNSRQSLSGGNGFTGVPPSQAVVLRRLGNRDQIAIRVNLNKALTNSNERILIMPGDTILVHYKFEEELFNALFSLIRVNFLFNGFNGGGF